MSTIQPQNNTFNEQTNKLYYLLAAANIRPLFNLTSTYFIFFLSSFLKQGKCIVLNALESLFFAFFFEFVKKRKMIPGKSLLFLEKERMLVVFL